MKIKNLLIIPFLIISANALADVDVSQFDKTIDQILELSTQGQNAEACLKAAMASSKLAEEISVGQIHEQIDDQIQAIRNEVLTKSETSGGSFGLLFGLFSGSAAETTNYYNIVVANSDEVLAQNKMAAQHFREMQINLRDYIRRNELALFYAKVFAAKSLQLAATLDIQELKLIYPTLSLAVQRISLPEFSARQSVLSCVTTNYAPKLREEGFKILGRILSLSLSHSETEPARSERECSQVDNEIRLGEASAISFRLMVGDLELKKYAKELSLKILAEGEAEPFPTWGSPYFKGEESLSQQMQVKP